MIPFGDKTVTIFHMEGGTVIKAVLSGCSISTKMSRTVFDGVVSIAAESICRAPAQIDFMPKSGDVIVPGECDDTVINAIELSRLLDRMRQRGAFQIETVSNNTLSGVLPHIAMRGA